MLTADYGRKGTTDHHPNGPASTNTHTRPNSENQRIILDMIHGIYNYDGKVSMDKYSR